MSPAFSSIRQAGGFVLLLIFLLLLPVLVRSSALPSREQIYASLPWNVGPYPFIHDQIYDEKKDIDIAIMGDSQTWAAINTPYLQQQLSAKLRRPAVVVTLCCPWAGFDGVYFLARDLLEHRKVRMLVFSDASGLNGIQDAPHKQSWRWFRFAEDAEELAGLPLRLKLSYYYGSILGMPRNLINLLRPAGPPVLTEEKEEDIVQAKHWIMPEKNLGALTVQISYNSRPDLFTKFDPETSTRPSDFVIYSPQTSARFQFGSGSTSNVQVYFAKKLAALAQAHRTSLTCLNVPFIFDTKSNVIKERYNWAVALKSPVTMVGIPPATLFDGLSDRDISNMFWDPFHLNENGQKYFTRLLAPNLITIYDDTKKN